MFLLRAVGSLHNVSAMQEFQTKRVFLSIPVSNKRHFVGSMMNHYYRYIRCTLQLLDEVG